MCNSIADYTIQGEKVIIRRNLTPSLQEMAKQFPVVAVMGPRQSGKTTLVKTTFSDYAYVTLEDLDKKQFAKEDPRGFLLSFGQAKGLIIDEIQNVPELFSYMQGIVDQENKPGLFIVTGSQHFLVHEKISQTLAGRIALLTLLPFSINELQEAQLLEPSVEDQIVKGFYPRLYAQTIDRDVWYANYISTYVEKDVRQILQITDIITFQRFIKLCAARIGNILNLASLARDADISPNTAKAWIAILEASYIIKLVYPYYKNFNKRVIKSPKLYFYDPGLACTLLGIRTTEDLRFHPIKGALFESMTIAEMFKFNFNHNQQPQIYFWRDVQGHEVDAIIERALDVVIPIEIKAGMTVMNDFFKNLTDWQEITKNPYESYLVYTGNEKFKQKQVNIYGWRLIDTMLEKIYS